MNKMEHEEVKIWDNKSFFLLVAIISVLGALGNRLTGIVTFTYGIFVVLIAYQMLKKQKSNKSILIGTLIIAILISLLMIMTSYLIQPSIQHRWLVILPSLFLAFPFLITLIVANISAFEFTYRNPLALLTLFVIWFLFIYLFSINYSNWLHKQKIENYYFAMVILFLFLLLSFVGFTFVLIGLQGGNFL